MILNLVIKCDQNYFIQKVTLFWKKKMKYIENQMNWLISNGSSEFIIYYRRSYHVGSKKRKKKGKHALQEKYRRIWDEKRKINLISASNDVKKVNLIDPFAINNSFAKHNSWIYKHCTHSVMEG